jgi:hypothetical protein
LRAADGSEPEHLSQKIACGDVTNPARYVAASQGCQDPQSTWKTHLDDRGLIKASLSGARATVATRLWRDRVPFREQERNEALASARIAEERVALLSLEASPTGADTGTTRNRNAVAKPARLTETLDREDWLALRYVAA